MWGVNLSLNLTDLSLMFNYAYRLNHPDIPRISPIVRWAVPTLLGYRI